MGGSCISRPKKPTKNNDCCRSSRPHNSEQINCIYPAMEFSLRQSHISYPYFQASWKLISPTNKRIDVQLKQLRKKLTGLPSPGFMNNLLTHRCYSYSRNDSTRQFGHTLKYPTPTSQTQNIQSFASNLIYKATILESACFGSCSPLRLQLTPETEFVIMGKESAYEFKEESSIDSPEILPKQFLTIRQPNPEQLLVEVMSGESFKKQLLSSVGRRMHLSQNCLVNGILIEEPSPREPWESMINSEIRPDNEKNNCLVVELLNVVEGHKLGQMGDRLFCYINPLIRCLPQPLTSMRLQKCQYSSYLQFKALIEEPELDLPSLFNPQLILSGSKFQLAAVYILLFAVKTFMHTHRQLSLIPVKFINELLAMSEGEHQIISNVVNVIKVLYVLVACNGYYKYESERFSNLVTTCCQSILQASVVNSHVLIDAYFLEFGIEIEEKSCAVRQNPLLRPQQPIRLKYKIMTKPSLLLINSLKQVQRKFKPKIVQLGKAILHPEGNNSLQEVSKRQELFDNWIKESLECIDRALKNESSAKVIAVLLQNKSNDYTVDDYTTDVIVVMQYFFGIKLYQFMCHTLTQMPSLLMLGVTQSGMRNGGIAKMWQNLIDYFMNNNVYNYCSGELGITILTLDGLVKNMQNQLGDDCEQIFTKALEIWMRIYREPRSKYDHFLSNSWLVYIIRMLFEIKSKNITNPQNSQELFYLSNMLECFNCRTGWSREKEPAQSFEWVVSNIPIGSISGIFYSRADLFLPPDDEMTISLMRTGTSLIENQNDNLSSKSNLSDSASNSVAETVRVKRKARRKVSDFVSLAESRAMRNGVYQWGKGVSSIPLLYPLAKNLDVFKIACGNYHVVIASAVGVYGWGENSAGQLGDPNTRESIKTIKLVLERRATCASEVDVACGNEHTAILFKEKPLVMLGQREGGIISGNGHSFEAVSCGGLHTLGLRKGRVSSWGRGEGGQLGHRPQHLKTKIKKQTTEFYMDEPRMISGLPNIRKTVCGDAHSVVLAECGEVYVFGFSYQGQLGLGLTGDCEVFQVFEPVKLELSGCIIVDVFAGSTFTFFKTSSGDVFSCGLNDCNQLGHQKMMRVFHKKKIMPRSYNVRQQRLGEVEYSRPNKLELFNSQIKINKIYCGENHCFAAVEYLQRNKMMMGWGLNKQYQISNEFPLDNITPRTIDSIYDFNFGDICCGSTFSLGIIHNENRFGMEELKNIINKFVNNSLKFNIKYSNN